MDPTRFPRPDFQSRITRSGGIETVGKDPIDHLTLVLKRAHQAAGLTLTEHRRKQRQTRTVFLAHRVQSKPKPEVRLRHLSALELGG